MENAKLIESNARTYLCHTLNICHEKRIQLYLFVLNSIVIFCFIGVFGSALYFCYNKQITPYEKHNKQLKDQEYIISKIRHYQTEKYNQHESLTNLPNLYSPTFNVSPDQELK